MQKLAEYPRAVWHDDGRPANLDAAAADALAWFDFFRKEPAFRAQPSYHRVRFVDCQNVLRRYLTQETEGSEG